EVPAVRGVQGDGVAAVDVVPARRETVVVADEDEATLTGIVGVVVVTGPRAEDTAVGTLGDDGGEVDRGDPQLEDRLAVGEVRVPGHEDVAADRLSVVDA